MEKYDRIVNLLRQAINTTNQSLPQDKLVVEAMTSIRTAITKLEQAGRSANLRKKQENQKQYEQTWGKTVAKSPTANQAVMRTWKDLNKMITDEMKKLQELENLENSVQQSVSKSTEILKD